MTNGLTIMGITGNLLTRALIWLLAVALPVQGLPAASCDCASGVGYGDVGAATSDCCSAAPVPDCCQRRSSTARPAAASACCSANTSSDEGCCRCGTDCQCCRTPRPASPVAPAPAERGDADKVASDLLATASTWAACRPEARRCALRRADIAFGLAALQRCTLLCRFTL